MNRAGYLLVVAAFIAGFVLPAPVLAAPTCAELAYGSPTYQTKMDELAGLAQIPGASWNRHHESVVAGLCAGNTRQVDRLVEDGWVLPIETVRMAAFLGIAYQPPPRSTIGQKTESTRGELVRMGVCAACADQIAQYHARKPASRCAKLAKRALNGDSRAIDELVDFPDYCRWAYSGVPR